MSSSATFTCLTKGRFVGSILAGDGSPRNPRNSLPVLILNTGKTGGKVKEREVLSDGLTVSRGVTRIQRRSGGGAYSSTALTITCLIWHPFDQDVFGNSCKFPVSPVR